MVFKMLRAAALPAGLSTNGLKTGNGTERIRRYYHDTPNPYGNVDL
jgi:hypothetical protein